VRLLLFTGKGGVGKTTVAAATGVHASRCGLKTLLVSTDPAHSLADALDVPLGPTPLEPESGLSAVQVDARARGERSWRSVQEYLIGMMDALGVDPISAEELTVLPGAQEVLALLEVRDLAVAGGYDLMVVDCAPTAETLRLLALPEAIARSLEKALPVQRRILRAMAVGARLGARSDGRTRGTGVGAGAGAGRGAVPTRDHVVEAAERLHAELAGVREVLTAPQTSVRLVVTPESVVLAEARRTWTSLALYGYPVDGVVANRLMPSGGRDAWRAGWARAQAVRMAELADSFRDVPIVRAGYASDEPVGMTLLAGLGEELYGAPDARTAKALLAAPSVAAPLRVERDGDEFVLVLTLPLALRDEVDLARVGDDLRLEVAGHRRMLALPSALRRCVVTSAALRDGALRVRFRPDPALWRAP
jgi:arsenite-transporting ATPase